MPRKRSAECKRVRVGAVQMISGYHDLAGNLKKAIGFCDKAQKRGVQILCLPECAATGFDWLRSKQGRARVASHAEPVPGPIVERFADKARATDMYIIMGMVERPKGSKKLFNTAFVVGPQEGYMGRFRKVRSESVLFTDGEDAPVFDTRYGQLGVFICADMRSPELLRLLVLKGARMLFQPTNYYCPNHQDVDIRRWYLGKQTAQRRAAMDNGVPLVIANAGQHEYVNDSRIIRSDSQGPEPVLARATRKEQLIVADIEVDPDGEGAPISAAKRHPWLFKELAQRLRDAADR